MSYEQSPPPTSRTTPADTGAPVTHVIVERSSTTGWVVAAIVAVIAIVAVAFMVNLRSPDTSQAQVATALEQGRSQGAAEAQATANMQAGLNAQAMSAQIATERAAAQTQQAAADARASADQAAANVADAAQDASDRISAESNGQVAPPQ